MHKSIQCHARQRNGVTCKSRNTSLEASLFSQFDRERQVARLSTGGGGGGGVGRSGRTIVRVFPWVSPPPGIASFPGSTPQLLIAKWKLGGGGWERGYGMLHILVNGVVDLSASWSEG